MEIILFAIVLYSIGKAIKALARPSKASRTVTKQTATRTTCLTALTALQEQRDLIQDMISDIDSELDNCPPEKRRYQLQTRKQQLLNKLASVESKIDKLIH